ncbi:MAG TPA: M56 family metallopeptidase [Terracidiphilus sp.]|nr:M56 family metallopeptidase [Terracidiphilus sp.]
MISDLLRATGNHLWQTTLSGLGAAALTLLFSNAPAKARSWIWLAVSLKFLLPFSLLLAVGSRLAPARGTSAALEPAPFYSVDTISQPFTYTPKAIAGSVRSSLRSPSTQTERTILILATALWLAGSFTVLCAWIVRWRHIARALKGAQPAFDGLEAEILRKMEAARKFEKPIPLLLSETSLEPGIFGIWNPTLVWPRGISQKLSKSQIEAIMVHELEHVRRRDNLAAALHMLVEATFWFHPMVWWLHKRLIEERERACDEAVLLLGSEPEAYAEGILRACQFSLESPLPCVAGISGSELKQRVRRIVAEEPARDLARTSKFLLGSLGACVLLIPIVFGLIDAPRVSAGLLQDASINPVFHFEVATIKPSKNDGGPKTLLIMPDRFTALNFPLREILMFAYDAKSTSQISGYPDWVASAAFDIEAKEDEATAAALDKMPRDERNQRVRLMLQGLLEERFHLAVSHETKDLPIYALVVAKGGPKLKPSPAPVESDASPAPGGPPKMRMGIRLNGPGNLNGFHATLDMLANGILSRMPEVGDRVVVNKTGLAGNYDFTLKWTPENMPPGANEADAGLSSADNAVPGLFTALEEQLGLKLDSQKGSVETLVVDSIDRPTPN